MLADQIIRILERYRPSRETQLQKKEVGFAVRDIASELIQATWKEYKKMKEATQLSHIYMGEMDLTVQENPTTKVNYVDLPVVPEDLPDGTGIREVWPATGKPILDREPIIPLPPNARSVLMLLPAGALELRFGYIPRGLTLEFTKKKDKTLKEWNISKVRAVIITTSIENAGDDDPFPISPHLRPQLIIRALQIFGMGYREAVDAVNDNLENPV